MADERNKKIERCKYAHNHFDGTYSCVQAGWDDDKVVPTDEAKCEACENYKSRYIEYPLTINGIDTEKIKYEDSWHAKTGQLVAVRPCGDEYGKKTYVGFYLGDLPLCITHRFNESTGILKAGTMTNPAMFVPELGKIIWGCGSWWHKIESEEQLREISDEDINSVWYVQLAKAMSAKEEKKEY